MVGQILYGSNAFKQTSNKVLLSSVFQKKKRKKKNMQAMFNVCWVHGLLDFLFNNPFLNSWILNKASSLAVKMTTFVITKQMTECYNRSTVLKRREKNVPVLTDMWLIVTTLRYHCLKVRMDVQKNQHVVKVKRNCQWFMNTTTDIRTRCEDISHLVLISFKQLHSKH